VSTSWAAAVAELEAERLEEAVDERRALRMRQLKRLRPEDRLLYMLAYEIPPRFTKVELACRFRIARSTMYERLARIKKELKPRVCGCGCGAELPRTSSRRRRYLNDMHRIRAWRRR
jgi:hypothetical protein